MTEIEHFLHQQHPLKKLFHMVLDLNEEAPDQWERTCAGCDDVLHGKVYACDTCRFYLHESCASLPQKTDHSFHPCPLFLKLVPKSQGTGSTGGEQHQETTLSYRCEACNFELMDAAFGQCQPIEKGILHFSHTHPLRLSYEVADAEHHCNGCKKPVSGNSYKCYSCGYYLHETCVNLPRNIRHFFHPCPLSLKMIDWVECDICYKPCYDMFVYHCHKCDFNMHVECTKFQPISSEEEGILHVSHHHPLKLLRLQSAEHLCKGCKKPISGKFYACCSCGYYLHETCAKLPHKIQHFFHPCPLFLKSHAWVKCDACYQQCYDKFVYYCDKCHFSMDIECSQFEPIHSEEEGILNSFHHHPLKLSYVDVDADANAVYYCRGCKKLISGKTYACQPCGFYFDETCANLLHEIRHFFHPCPLFLHLKTKTICEACYRHDQNIFVYHCRECNFSMHVECSKFQHINSEDGGDKVQHWSHHHPLQLEARGKGFRRNLNCAICRRGISGQTDYAACESCEFHTHRSCMDLSREIQHRCHPCLLSLGLQQQFDCNACLDKISRCWAYQCKKCDFYMDVKCALFSQKIVQGGHAEHILHFSHHHPLWLFKDPKRDNMDIYLGRKLKCLLCKELVSGLTYGCKKCDVYLHKSCLDVLSQTISLADGSFVLMRLSTNYLIRTARDTNCECGNDTLGFYFCEVPFNQGIRRNVWCVACALEKALSIQISISSMLIQLHFHPCSLTLKLFPIFTCNVCFTHCDTYAYYCDQCDFYVGIKCAQIYRKTSFKAYKKHFCHWHPLENLQDIELSTAFCKVCGILCSKPSYFCKECNFYIHKVCLEMLPLKIDKHYFNWTLVFLSTSFYKCTICQKENNSGLTFRSIKEGFKLCMECVLWPKNKLNNDGTFTSIHHWHPLVLIDNLEQDTSCLLCRKKISTLTYYCSECKDYFHKTCAELPFEIQRPLHHEHPLTLINSDLLPESSRSCSLCLGKLLHVAHHSGVYHCKDCKVSTFQLDKKCATCIPSIQYEDHPHLLTVVENMHGKEVCRVCSKHCLRKNDLNFQEKEGNCVFRCVRCNYTLHLKCGPLPRTIVHPFHVHPLVLEDFSEEENYMDKFACHFCEDWRDPRLPVYHCTEDCAIICEIMCVFPEVMAKLLGDHGDVGLRTIYPSVASKVIRTYEVLKAKKDISKAVTHKRFDLKDWKFGDSEQQKLMRRISRVWKDVVLSNCNKKFDKEDEDEGEGEDKNMFKFSKEAFSNFSSKLGYTPLSLEIDELPDFVMQHNLVILGNGEYWLPKTLVPICKELLGKYKIFDTTSDSYMSASFISYYVFMLCAVLHNMRTTKTVDVTCKRVREWLTMLKLVEEAGFNIRFISDKIKLVWKAHFLIKSKAIVDEKSRKLQGEFEQLARKEEDLQKQLKETREEMKKIEKQQEDHFKYMRGGMKDLRKEHANALLIKWKPTSSVILPDCFVNPFKWNEMGQQVLFVEQNESEEEKDDYFEFLNYLFQE